MFDKNQLANLISFCALMENDDGIAGKSPEYIWEKYQRYVADTALKDAWKWGLDKKNAEKVFNYFTYWQIKL